jgi:hypothetical protein
MNMTLYFLLGAGCGGATGEISRRAHARYLTTDNKVFLRVFAIGMAARLLLTLLPVLLIARHNIMNAAFFGAGMILLQTVLLALPPKKQ